ncbi:hypothetical protein AB5I41_02535 [Sphingomonas sp. MMS24-JH45]
MLTNGVGVNAIAVAEYAVMATRRQALRRGAARARPARMARRMRPASWSCSRPGRWSSVTARSGG